jgi:hypothetical protein
MDDQLTTPSHLVTSYKLIDDTFINIWNRGHSSVSPSWIARLQTQLSETVPAYIECSEQQVVEIRVTQHWLKAMVWQLSFCHGLIGNVPNEPCLTAMYLIGISRDLLSMTQQFAHEAMEIHGAGLVSCPLQSRFSFTSRLSMSSSDHQWNSVTAVPVTHLRSSSTRRIYTLIHIVPSIPAGIGDPAPP